MYRKGPPAPTLGDPAAWLREGREARSGADRVLAGADVLWGEVVEGEAQMFPDFFHKELGGVLEGSPDVDGGNDEVHWVHVGGGVLEEDGLVWESAREGSPQSGRYVRVQLGADAA